MTDAVPIRLAANSALKQKRLAALLAGRPESDPALQALLEDAQLLGSLELAGSSCTWEEVRAARRGARAPDEAACLRAARGAVAPDAVLSLDVLARWHAAASGQPAAFRGAAPSGSRVPPGAPPEFIASRLQSMVDWLGDSSQRELRPDALGALVMARIVEIRPFADCNGRVARLAASHLMVQRGARPPILVGADRSRLQAALAAAFELDTEPLCRLLDEASARALDVLIQALEAERPLLDA